MTNPLYDLFNSDKSTESEGKWVYPAGEGKDLPAFKVARAGGSNKAFTKAQMANLKPNQRLIQANAKNPSPEVLEIIQKAQKDSFVTACMMDWKNVQSVDGTPLSFSKENAKMLMDKLPDLYDFLYDAANSITTFQAEDVADEAKN